MADGFDVFMTGEWKGLVPSMDGLFKEAKTGFVQSVSVMVEMKSIKIRGYVVDNVHMGIL